MKSQLFRGPANVQSTLQLLQARLELKYKVSFRSYWDLHRWSVENHTKFWAELWDFFGIISSEYYSEILEGNKTFKEIPRWFLGAKLNYAENMLRHPDEDLALIITGEERMLAEEVTFGQLKDEVSLMSSALRKAGVQIGDTIACLISNRKEAIVTMLAAASIGAQFSATNSLMGTQAILSRFEQINPKVLITIDRYLYDKKEINILSRLPELTKGLPNLKHVVIVPSNNDSFNKDLSQIPNSKFLSEFLMMGLEDDGSIPAPHYEQLSFNHPLIINYTSGTSGKPKGIVHSAGASLLGPLTNSLLMFNVKKSDVMFTIHNTGWVSWNIYLGAMAVGAALLVYEGVPFFEYGTKTWDLVDEHAVTYLFLVPSVLEEMEKYNLGPGSHNNLKHLHTLFSGSAPVKPHTFDYVKNSVKADVFFCLVYGSTEFMSMTYGMNHHLPVYKSEMQAPCLGIDLQCYSDEGNVIHDEPGELVIAKEYPTMPLYFIDDPNNERYDKTFFSTYEGVWRHGDSCTINSETKGLIVHGRSDETIKQRGARFGSSEIYAVVNKIDGVLDSICASRLDSEGDEIAFLFLKMKKDTHFSESFLTALRKEVENELSFRHVPEQIFQVQNIPYNVNGKKLEVLVKKILSGADNIPSEAAAEPDHLLEYVAIAKTLEKNIS